MGTISKNYNYKSLDKTINLISHLHSDHLIQNFLKYKSLQKYILSKNLKITLKKLIACVGKESIIELNI